MKKFSLTSSKENYNSVMLFDSERVYAQFFDYESTMVLIDYLISQHNEIQFTVDVVETFNGNDEYSYRDMRYAINNCFE